MKQNTKMSLIHLPLQTILVTEGHSYPVRNTRMCKWKCENIAYSSEHEIGNKSAVFACKIRKKEKMIYKLQPPFASPKS